MVKWNIATFARIRPPRRSHECAKFILEKLDNGTQTAARISFPPPGEDELSAADRFSMKQRELLQFQYNDIFDPGVSQDDVFNAVCRGIVESALDGYNGSILAYGQTGSGKTYTITGGEHYADRGIIPRVLSTIFEAFERRAATVRYACYVSYLEIYNESVYDLLDRSHTDRPIEEWTKVLLLDDDDGEMHFRNLGVYEAVSEEEALNLLFLGNMNRVTSDTPMNQASSRSHSVFSVMLEARPLDSDVIVTSKLHLVDLAGSERVYKREGTQRMRTEGKHINLSLHHLEQVILSLRTAKKPSGGSSSLAKSFHVPYRNSMLTSVLRGSLGGNCKSVFIATLNPESEFVDESISTCRFMQRCAEVAVDVGVNSEVDTEKRLLALEKTNSELEAAALDFKARIVQLERELQASSSQVAKYQKDQTQWQRDRAELLAQVAHWQAKQRVEEPLRWSVCEELVEKLLLTGDVPRCVAETVDDNDVDVIEDDEKREARQLFQECIREIRTRGLACAVGCLTVLRESTVFASNTAAELQEMMETQTQTVALLEQRLREQKLNAEALKAQVAQLLAQTTRPGTRAPADAPPPANTVPRAQAASRHSHRSGGGSSSGGVSRVESDGSDSDSELDTDATDARPYPHPSTSHQQQQQQQSPPSSSATTMSLVFHGPRSASAAAPVTPFPGVGLLPKQPQQQPNPATDELLTKASPSLPPPPPSTAQPAKSGSDMIRRRMDLLKNGSLFVKYGRFGKPHVRFVWCSADLEYIHYRQASAAIAKAAIPTRSVHKVVSGQHTRVFERARQPTREPFCFSIEYDDGTTRTLDLEVTDGDGVEQKKTKRNEWVEALQFLVKLKAAQQKKAPQAVPPRSTPMSS